MVDSKYEAALARGESVTYAGGEAESKNRHDQWANVLTPVEPQLRWLREAGFSDVDCYWRCFELAIFGGYKWWPVSL